MEEKLATDSLNLGVNFKGKEKKRVLYDEGEKGDLLLVHPKTHGDTWRLGFECMW